VGWLAIVADGSQLCCPKSNFDDGCGANLAGIRMQEWWETVVKWEVVMKIGVSMKGNQMEHDWMETIGLREVMVCSGGVHGIGRRAWWETVVK